LHTCKELHRAQMAACRSSLTLFFLHECKPLAHVQRIAPGAKKWRPLPIEFNVTVTLILYVRTFAAKPTQCGRLRNKIYAGWKIYTQCEGWENKKN
jgi:hypothetical protein